MDTTVRAETKRCALLANKAAAKARDGDWAAACRALEDIEHGPGNAASQASAPQVVEPTEPVAWYRTYYDQRMGISWDRVQPTLPGWGEHPLYDAPQASAPSVQVVPLTNDQLDAASTSEGGNLDLRRSFRAGALWAEEHHREALAQASALPTAQQPAVEPVTLSLCLDVTPQQAAALTWQLAEQFADGRLPKGFDRIGFIGTASPTAQPAALSLHERYWLDIRGKVIDALAAKGLQIVTTAHGVHLMPLGNAAAQPAADVAADARRWQALKPFFRIEDVGDEDFVFGLVVDSEALEEAAQRAKCWRGAVGATVDAAVDALAAIDAELPAEGQKP